MSSEPHNSIVFMHQGKKYLFTLVKVQGPRIFSAPFFNVSFSVFPLSFLTLPKGLMDFSFIFLFYSAYTEK